MYSAVHHQGVRLYELARQGQVVARKKRPAQIKTLELLQFDDQPNLPVATLRVVCSRGTYIRTLCHDIGQELGTGAFLSALTRIRSGGFLVSQAVNLEQVIQFWSESRLLPMDYPLQQWAKIVLDLSLIVRAMQNGQTISVNDLLPPDLVRVYKPDNRLLALAKVNYTEGKCNLKPERVFHI